MARTTPIQVEVTADVVLPTEVTEAIKAARPLTATAARAAKEIIKNDFETLAAELDMVANKMESDAVAKVTAEYAKKGTDVESYVARARALIHTFKSAHADLQAEARRNGIALSTPGRYDWDSPTAEAEGLNAALSAARREVNTKASAARLAMRRQQLTAERQILLAQVTTEIEPLLKSIPSARTLLSEVGLLSLEA